MRLWRACSRACRHRRDRAAARAPAGVDRPARHRACDRARTRRGPAHAFHGCAARGRNRVARFRVARGCRRPRERARLRHAARAARTLRARARRSLYATSSKIAAASRCAAASRKRPLRSSRSTLDGASALVPPRSRARVEIPFVPRERGRTELGDSFAWYESALGVVRHRVRLPGAQPIRVLPDLSARSRATISRCARVRSTPVCGACAGAARAPSSRACATTRRAMRFATSIGKRRRAAAA